jgi:ABC-type nitrate/sulfonate/bicarbonate transport system substrate-binding protein
VLVTSQRLLRTQPSLVRRTLAAIQEGYAFALHHPAQAAQDLLRAAPGLSPRLVHQSLALLAPAFDYHVPTVGYQDVAAWRTYMRWMLRYHLLSRPVNVSQAVTNAYLTPHVG